MKKRILAVVLTMIFALGMVACSKESEGVLTFDIPEEFVYDDARGVYFGPDGIANINYNSVENDGSFRKVTQSSMEKALEEGYADAFGENIDITITGWEKTEVDGYDALLYSWEYDFAGYEFLQIQVMINGTDYFHYVTLTDTVGSEYADDFRASVNTMTFE